MQQKIGLMLVVNFVEIYNIGRKTKKIRICCKYVFKEVQFFFFENKTKKNL